MVSLLHYVCSISRPVPNRQQFDPELRRQASLSASEEHGGGQGADQADPGGAAAQGEGQDTAAAETAVQVQGIVSIQGKSRYPFHQRGCGFAVLYVVGSSLVVCMVV